MKYNKECLYKMGVIQSSINQLLGTSALAAKLSPTVQRKSEERDIKQDIKNLQAKDTALEQAKNKALAPYKIPDYIDEDDPNNKAIIEEAQKETTKVEGAYNTVASNLGENLLAKQSRLLELNPSSELAGKILANQRVLDAMSRMRDQATAKIEQGKKLDALKKEIFEGNKNLAGYPEFQKQAIQQNPQLKGALLKTIELEKQMGER